MGFSASYVTIVCVGFFAWTAVTLAISSASLREGGLVCQEMPTGRVYHAHPCGRIFAAMMGLLFTVGAPLIYGLEALEWAQQHQASSDLFPLVLLLAMNFAMGGLMFWLAGPNDFFIDLDRRTYRHVYGWSFNQQVKTGSMDDDLAGVFVRCVSMNSRYDIGLAWKRGQKWKRLVMLNRSGRADRCAEETAAALGLPLVPPPSHLKSSSDVRNGLG